MPPNLPTGWQIPAWLQVVAVLAFISTPFVMVFLNYWKDRRPQNLQRDQALMDDQQSYIEKLLAAANKVPELLQKLEDLMNINSGLRNDINDLKAEIRELKARVAHLEEERDMWRRQAERVPQLEGQIETLTLLLKAKQDELVALELRYKQGERI